MAQMGSHFAQNTTSNPFSLLSSHTPLLGIRTYTKHPQTYPKHPISFESGQNELPSGQNETPTGQYVRKMDKTFQDVGQKKISCLAVTGVL